MSLLPSDEQARDTRVTGGMLFEVQVLPESTEVYTAFLPVAASLLPLADEATAQQLGATSVRVQLPPEFVEV